MPAERKGHCLPAGRTGALYSGRHLHGMHGQRSICRQAPPRLKTLSSTWRVMDGRVRGAFNHWASILHILHNVEDIGLPWEKINHGQVVQGCRFRHVLRKVLVYCRMGFSQNLRRIFQFNFIRPIQATLLTLPRHGFVVTV
jgi:hypothetical protein